MRFRNFIGALLVSLPGITLAATCTSSGNGNWNAGGTWAAGCGANGPVAGDTVIISNTDTVTVPTGVAAAAGSVQIGTGASGAAALTLNAATSSLTVSGGVTIKNSGNNNIDAFNVNAGTASMATLTFDNSASTGRTVRLLITTGTATVTGDVIFAAVNTAIQITFTGAGTLNVGGDLPSGATFTRSTSTVNFNGAGAQAIGTYTYNNLSVTKSSGTATLLGNTSIVGNLSVSCPATCVDGTLDLSTFTANRSAAGGTISVGSDATLKIGGTNGFPANYSTRTLANKSTVDYSGTAQTVAVNNPAVTYGNLTLSGSGTKTLQAAALSVTGSFTMNGTASATAAAAMTVGGNFTVNAGTSFDAASFTHNVGGDFTNNGATFTATTSTFNFNGTSTQNINGTASTSFNKLTLNNAAGLTLGIDTTVSGTAAGSLTLTSGIVTTGSNTLFASGNCTTATVSRAVTAWVAGFLKKTIPTGSGLTCVWEVGGPTNYRPISLTFASVTGSGAVTGSVTQSSGDHPQNLTSGIDPLKNVNRYWTLTNSGLAFTNYSATFTFVAGDIDAAASTLTSLFEIERYDGVSWNTTTAGTRNATNTTATGITGMSDFVVGRKKVDHYSITVPASGDTCTAASVTVTARDAANATMTDYTGTMNITTSTNDGDWSTSATGTLNNGTADDGAASYSFVSADAGIVTVSLSNIQINSNVTVSVVDTARTSSGTTSASIPFRGNTFSIGNDTIQVAGRSQSMTVTRIRGASCTTTLTEYAGAKALKAWYTADVAQPAGAAAPSISGMVSPPLGTSVPAGNNLTLTFASGAASFTLTTTDVGKYQINLRDDAVGTVDGASATITTRPFAIVVSAIKQSATNNPGGTATAGSKFIVAADSFQATVGAYLWSAAADSNNDGLPDATATLAQITAIGATPAYSASTTLSAGAPFTPTTGTAGTLGNATQVGACPTGSPNCFTNGVATPTNISYSEVGSFTLSVGTANFLGVDLVSEGRTLVFDNSATPQRSGVVGRFYPDHFTVTASSVTAFCSGFTYMGQGALGYSFTIEARNKSNVKTTKYDSPAYSTGTVSQFAENNDNGTDLSTRLTAPSSSWSTGSYAFTTSTAAFSRLASPDGPYDSLQLGLTVTDGDGAVLSSRDMNPTTAGACGGSCTGVAIGTTKVRFGRLRLLPATGPSYVNLAIPIRLEYWNGTTGFVTNTDDNACTTLSQANIKMDGFAKNLSACETRLYSTNASNAGDETITFANGQGKAFLRAPGSSNEGSVVLTAKLASSTPGVDRYCRTVGAGLTDTSAAAKSYLQGNWGTATYDRDPSARAAFGVYGSQPKPFIFQREAY